MQERFETFTVLIGRIGRDIRRLKTEQMESMELKGPYVSCLYYLYTFGPLTAAELCERCEEDKAAISRSLDQLEREGYLCSRASGKKYRSPLELTEKGREVGAEVARRIGNIVQAASESLTEADREIMYRSLETICRNLEQFIHKENR